MNTPHTVSPARRSPNEKNREDEVLAEIGLLFNTLKANPKDEFVYLSVMKSMMYACGIHQRYPEFFYFFMKRPSQPPSDKITWADFKKCFKPSISDLDLKNPLDLAHISQLIDPSGKGVITVDKVINFLRETGANTDEAALSDLKLALPKLAQGDTIQTQHLFKIFAEPTQK